MAQKIFLLSTRERDFLKPFSKTVQDILINFRHITITDENRATINDAFSEELRKACKKNNLNVGKALKLSEALLNSKWYCVYLTGFFDGTEIPQYMLITSDAPAEEKLLTLEEHAAFYDVQIHTGNKFRAIERNALGLSPEYLFISADDFEALTSIYETFTGDQALQTAPDLPYIKYHNSNRIKTATDKLANVFFSLSAPTSPGQLNGQLEMIPLSYEGIQSKKDITLFYCFEYDEQILKDVGAKKGFDSYDFFVASAIDNLRANGNTIVSYSKLLEAMGETGKPAQKQKNKLYQALKKGSSTSITIDDRDIQEAWGNTSGTYTELSGPVFPVSMSSEKFIANGYVADGKIEIYNFTPFMRLAAGIGHVTEWDKKILQLYTGRKTERYWSTLHFLIREIGWMRNKKSKRNNKILYSSLYANNGDHSTRDKQLTRDMLYRLLDEVFKATGYISAYKEDATTTPGVILTLSAQYLPGQKNQNNTELV